MRDILLKHFEKYPKMQVTDAVKLLYQSEFGGGHMIANPTKSLEWIQKEWKESQSELQKIKNSKECLQADQDAESNMEEIGGGICRINLHILDEGLMPETLNQIFVKTADRTVGTIENFEKKLTDLYRLCEEGKTPFKMEELESYLAEYKEKGYPPVSHSEIYRENYHPMYRVAASSYTRYLHVFKEIDRMLKHRNESSQDKSQVIVAIDGMCGSGKSTLGRVLKEIYDCNLFHMDDFFLRPEQKTQERFHEAGGNVDYERFKSEVLDHISDPEGFSYQIYHCGKQKLDRFVSVPYKQLNIIEGAYSEHPYFEDPYDLKFICKITPEEQVNRILKRNGPEMLKRFQEVWIPMENQYFETFKIEEKNIRV